MAETIFAGKKKKEFSLKNGLAIFTTINTVFSWFPKKFFMRNSPRNAGNGQRQ